MRQVIHRKLSRKGVRSQKPVQHRMLGVSVHGEKFSVPRIYTLASFTDSRPRQYLEIRSCLAVQKTFDIEDTADPRHLRWFRPIERPARPTGVAASKRHHAFHAAREIRAIDEPPDRQDTLVQPQRR